MGTHKSSANTSGDRKWKWLARGWLAVGLAVSAILFVRAMPHSPLRGSSQQAKPAAAVAMTTSAQEARASVGVPSGRSETVYIRRLITQPIETIRVGQRVLGTNPNRDEVEEFEEPDPKTWRTIEVEQIKPSGKKLYATLLRPLEWIEEELDPEANTIELDLPELGAEGEAKVLAIGPCPPIAPGNGHIVTATFKHEPDGELLTVTVGNDEIGCTANHPFWSEDRQEFVEARQLREGERVRTRLEQVAAVVAIKPRPPTDWVYNLEVQGEHVYEVGPNGLLVHNICPGYHHFFPRSLGNLTPYGHASLTFLSASDHTAVHDALAKFLRTKTKTVGGVVYDMLPRKGQSGAVVRRVFTKTERLKALVEFYKSYQGGKYYMTFLNEVKVATQKGWIR